MCFVFQGLCDIIKDCQAHNNTYNQVLISYENEQFSQWLLDLQINIPDDSMHIFDLVKEFLHNAGKNDVVTQCEKSELEVWNSHINDSLRSL